MTDTPLEARSRRSAPLAGLGLVLAVLGAVGTIAAVAGDASRGAMFAVLLVGGLLLYRLSSVD